MRVKLYHYTESPKKRVGYWIIRGFVVALFLYMGYFSLVAYQMGVEDTCRGMRRDGYTVR